MLKFDLTELFVSFPAFHRCFEIWSDSFNFGEITNDTMDRKASISVKYFSAA